nr:MarR family transcriptional regulator [Nocardioides soli]
MGEGEFDVLATLRRSGAPYELTPGELATQTMVSSGAVTKRVDRCVEQGWVTRRVSDSDARGRMVALTPAGVALIDEAFGAHMANEHRLVAMLDGAERTRLAQLLEKWGRALDA